MKTELKAAIFDVDGLILDSEVFYAKIWAEAFNRNSPKEYRFSKKSLMEWFYNNLSGKKMRGQIDFIQNNYKNNDIQAIYLDYRKTYKEKLLTEKIKTRKGFFELLNFLKQKNIKLGIASSSNYSAIENCFKNSNIDLNLFDVVVSGDMVTENKPKPEPYLKACEILNINPVNAISFEDSESGLMSSLEANIKCFLVPGRAPVNCKLKNKAYSVCKNLKECIKIIEENFSL